MLHVAWITFGVVAFGLASAAGLGLFHRRKRQRTLDAAADLWRRTPADRRSDVFEQQITERPTDAAGWYLHGCACLRTGQIGAAARSFGAAYHRDCDLGSAALLTFACLKSSADDEPMPTLRRHMRDTWQELNRPVL
ncbi:MAG: hypothetical protein V3T70_09945, partial [Phycisphaerae bacterium]